MPTNVSLNAGLNILIVCGDATRRTATSSAVNASKSATTRVLAGLIVLEAVPAATTPSARLKGLPR